jgi:HEAT repeat protein
VLAPLFFSQAYLDVARGHLAADDPAVRADAVTTLGREIVEPRALDEDQAGAALEVLLTAARDTDPGVRRALLAFLATQAGPERLNKAVNDEMAAWMIKEAGQNEDPTRRDLALEAMGQVSRSAFRNYLASRLDEPNPAVRLKLVRAMGGQHTIHAVAPLINLMNSDPLCRAEAEAALDRIYAEGSFAVFKGTDAAVKGALQGLTRAMAQHDAQLEAVMGEIHGRPAGEEPPGPLSAFERALQSPQAAERMRAVYELGRSGDAAARPLLVAALADSDERVGAAAALAVARLGGPGLVEELQQRVLIEASPSARGNVALALGFTGQRAAVDPLLVALAQERDYEARRSIVRALGELGEGHAAPGLRRAAAEDARLAGEVERALQRIGDG